MEKWGYVLHSVPYKIQPRTQLIAPANPKLNAQKWIETSLLWFEDTHVSFLDSSVIGHTAMQHLRHLPPILEGKIKPA